MGYGHDAGGHRNSEPPLEPPTVQSCAHGLAVGAPDQRPIVISGVHQGDGSTGPVTSACRVERQRRNADQAMPDDTPRGLVHHMMQLQEPGTACGSGADETDSWSPARRPSEIGTDGSRQATTANTGTAARETSRPTLSARERPSRWLACKARRCLTAPGAWRLLPRRRTVLKGR